MLIKELKIKINGLFGKYNYDLDLSKELNILIGENGDGKSTVIKIINYVFNRDYLSLSKVKFNNLSIKFDNNEININYNDLFADISTYFAAFSLVEDSIYRNANDYLRQFITYDDFDDYYNLNSYRNYKSSKGIDYVREFDEKTINPDSINTELIMTLVKKYGINSFNDYVSLVINYDKENFKKIFNQLVLNKKSIFKEISDYFSRKRITTFTHENFIEFIIKINKPLESVSARRRVKIIQNSRYLILGNLFEVINKTNTLLNSNLSFKNDLNQFNVKLLNMVQLYDLDSETLEEQSYYSRQQERTNRIQPATSQTFTDSNSFSVNLSISSIYKEENISEFINEFIKIATDDNYGKAEFNISDELSEENIKSFKDDLSMKFDKQIIRQINKYLWNSADRTKERSTDYTKTSDFLRLVRNFTSPYDSTRRARDVVSNTFDNHKIQKLNQQLDKLWASRLESVKNTEKAINDFLTNKEVTILQTKRFLIKDKFSNEVIPLELLSSGEKKIITMITAAFLGEQNGILILDEPELSLSIPWQEKLIDYMKQYKGKLIIATQSNNVVLDRHFEFVIPMLNKD
jgi:predicted ATPase